MYLDLTKLALDKENNKSEPTGSVYLDGTMTLAGLKGISTASPYIRGKYKFYHGSKADNIKKIKQEGIKTMEEMAARGESLTAHILKQQQGDIWDKSKEMAFVGKKSVAKDFIRQSTRGTDADFLREALVNGVSLKDCIKRAIPVFGTSPLKVEIPVSEKHRIASNPEDLTGFTKFKKMYEADPMGKLKLPPILTKIDQYLKDSMTVGIKGGVRSHEIVGGNGYKYFSPEGIRAKPGRALGGLAGGLLGLGLTGLGVSSIINNIKHKKLKKTAKSMELKELIKAKKMSDQKDYIHKNEIIRKMLEKNPTAFKVDSHLNRGYVGITHIKSGFKIHAPKHIVPSSLINPQTGSF